MAGMTKQKQRSLSAFFARYTAWVFVCVIFALLLAMALYALASQAGIVGIVPFTRQELENYEKNIERADTLDARSLSANTLFAVFSEDGSFIYGNADAQTRSRLWEYSRQPEVYPDVQGIVVRKGEEIRVVFVGPKSAFSNAWLRSLLPNPELLIFPLAIMLMLIGLIILSKIYGKRLAVQMRELKAAIGKIQQHDLDIDIGRSEIKEVSDVLCSMDEMKSALQQALLSQWDMEQSRDAQIHGLIHDIQTPLTVILGNAELLENAAPSQAGEYASYIMKNALLLRDYVNELKRINPGEAGTFALEKLEIATVWAELKELFRATSSAKQVVPSFEDENIEGVIMGDLLLLKRAFQNVLGNAVRYTPARGTVSLRLTASENEICFTIRDSGPGFSEEALRFATTPSFSEQENPALHGMGLAIADAIIKQHQGMLSIANGESGGIVTICLPHAKN